MYCILCGNEQAEAEDGIGDQCRVIVTTAPMDRAFAFWQECGERNRKCCGGLSHEKDHFYFHGKYWECSYPPQPEGRTLKNGTKKPPTKKAMKEWENLSVSVEMGVSFWNDCATTYFIFDADSYSDSQEYGSTEPPWVQKAGEGKIPYPADVSDQTFWDAIDKQLDMAAEAAFNSDILSCPKCSYHYCSSNGPCGCDGREE